MTVTRIDDYEVMYSANTFPPRIWLSNSGHWIGQLIFEPDGSVLPPNALVGGQANIYYHLENFQNVISLLQREKPMFLLFVGGGPGNEDGIMTTDHPPGH
jgi:hypothetical protein